MIFHMIFEGLTSNEGHVKLLQIKVHYAYTDLEAKM